MGLVRSTLRTFAIWALLEADTTAGERICDSNVTPLPDLAAGKPGPLILVSTDDDISRPIPGRPRDRERQLDLVIELLIADSIVIKGQQADITVPYTDGAMAFGLDIMEAEVRWALRDPNNPWGELFRLLRGEEGPILSRYGASTEKGVRFAARQLTLTIDPLQEPDFGSGAVPPPWDRITQQMRTVPDLALRADIIAALLTRSPLPPWQQLQARSGQTRDIMDAVGLGAIPGGEAEPPVTRLTVQTPRGDLVVYPE